MINISKLTDRNYFKAMGSIYSKLCGDKQKKAYEKKEHEEKGANGKGLAQPVDDSKAEMLTNGGGTLDVSSDKASGPNFLRDDSMARKMESKKEVYPTQNTPNINDGEKKKDEQNDRKTYTKKGKHDTSSSDTSSSSDSDYDHYKRKRKKKKSRDKVTVYKSWNVKGGVYHYHGNNITVNKNTVINKNLPASQKTDNTSLFTCMHDKKSAAEFRNEMFQQHPIRNNGICGHFIDLNPISLAEDASKRLAIDKWLGSVGVVVSPRGKFTCFRVGSKYVMTALHCIIKILTPEVTTRENAHREWRDFLHELKERTTSVDFHYLTDHAHRRSDMFFFKDVNRDSIPFFDESTDCIILELEQVSGRPLPPQFKEFGIPNLDHKITLIHHGGGQIKKVEQVSKIINMNAQKTREDSLKLSELSERFLNAKGRDVSRFRCEILPYDVLLNRNRILFHCQCSKGASGSPGLQVQSDKTVVVVTMVLHGYPDWYYSEDCTDIKHEWNKADTVEQGSNMTRVIEAIFDKNRPLFNDMFVPLSTSVEAVPP